MCIERQTPGTIAIWSFQLGTEMGQQPAALRLRVRITWLFTLQPEFHTQLPPHHRVFILYQIPRIIWSPRPTQGSWVCFRPRDWGQRRMDSRSQTQPDLDLSPRPLQAQCSLWEVPPGSYPFLPVACGQHPDLRGCWELAPDRDASLWQVGTL